VSKLFTNRKLLPLKTWFDDENITGAVNTADKVGELDGSPVSAIDGATKKCSIKIITIVSLYMHFNGKR
jgi:hypothetical protein